VDLPVVFLLVVLAEQSGQTKQTYWNLLAGPPKKAEGQLKKAKGNFRNNMFDQAAWWKQNYNYKK